MNIHDDYNDFIDTEEDFDLDEKLDELIDIEDIGDNYDNRSNDVQRY